MMPFIRVTNLSIIGIAKPRGSGLMLRLFELDHSPQRPGDYQGSAHLAAISLDHRPMDARHKCMTLYFTGRCLGGRDVKTCDSRSECALRLHPMCNSILTSLLARGKRIVVHGHRFSGDWSSAHSNERCGRSSQGGTPRVSAWLLRLRRVQQSVSLWVWNVPTV